MRHLVLPCVTLYVKAEALRIKERAINKKCIAWDENESRHVKISTLNIRRLSPRGLVYSTVSCMELQVLEIQPKVNLITWPTLISP